MKFYLKFILLCIIPLVFTACDKDDDGISADNLPGNWRMTDIHSENGVSTITFQGLPLTTDYSSEGITYNTTTTFTENPNEFTSEGSYVVRTTIETPGTPTTNEETIDAFPGTGTWVIEGNILTQTFSGQTTESEILELSKTKLRLKQDVDFSLDEQGIIFQTSATIFSSFEKQ